MPPKLATMAIAMGLLLNSSQFITYASSCSLHSSDALSCERSEFNCYRFDYSSINAFKKSIIRHAGNWKLDSPILALSKLVKYHTFESNIDSATTADSFVGRNPEYIFAFGQYIERENKPREWLFVAEQAFIRSWHSTLRSSSG